MSLPVGANASGGGVFSGRGAYGMRSALIRSTSLFRWITTVRPWVEWCLVSRAVLVAVLRIRECRRISVPVVLVFGDVSWHYEDRAVATLNLTVRLWVVLACEDVQDSEKRANGLE